MAILNDLMKMNSPGVNPRLEEMVSKLMLGSGSTPGQAAAGPEMVAQQMQQPSPMGTGAQQVGEPGMGQGMPPEEANLTYQALIKRGVPPEVAKQAIANPLLLKQLLGQLYGQPAQQQAPAPGPEGGGSMAGLLAGGAAGGLGR